MKAKNISYSFVSNLIFLIGINLIIKPVWIFVIDRNVQIHLGFEKYGIYYALLNLSYLFNVLLDLGLTNFHSREVAQKKSTFTQLFTTIFSLKWMLSAAYILGCLLLAFIWRYDSERIFLLLWLAASQVLISFVLFLRSTLSALQYYFLDSLLSVLDKALMILLIGYLLFFQTTSFTISQFVVAQFVANLFTFFTALILVLIFRKPMQKPKFSEVKNIISNALPFTFLLLWMTIYFRLDSVLVERLSKHQPQQESGIYAAAYRLLDMVNMFAYLFSMLLFPMFNRLITEKKSLQNLIGLSAPILLSSAWIISISISINRFKWFELLYHQQNNYAANVMAIVLFSFGGVALQYIFSTAVTAAGKLKLQNRAAFVAVVFNVVANIIFIPLYGAMAAAFIAFITLSGIGIYNYFLAKSIFNLSFDFQKKSLWCIWAIATFMLFYFASISSFNFYAQQFFALIASFVLGLVMRIFQLKNFVQILF